METYRIKRFIGRDVLPVRPGDEGLTKGQAEEKARNLRLIARATFGRTTGHRFKVEKEG